MSKKSIIFFGGSRWTRILIKEVISIKKYNFKIIIITPSNYKNICDWIKIEGISNTVSAFKKINTKISRNIFASIVSNSVKSHFDSILYSLKNNIPVLAEKPITENFFKTQKLVDISNNNNTFLAAAHIYFFAKNINRIGKDINQNYDSLKITWSDPQNEIRHGEKKNYDYTIPVFTEYLPHILSILEIITKSQNYKILNCKVLGGGSFVKLRMIDKKKNIELVMKRKSKNRIRLIECTNKKKKINYNFSELIPVVTVDGKIKKINFDHNDRPARTMLQEFFLSLENGILKRKFDPKFALKVNKVIDDVKIIYEKNLINTFNDLLKGSTIKNKDLHYMVKEIIADNKISNSKYDFNANLIIKNILLHRKKFKKSNIRSLKEIKNFVNRSIA